MKQPVDGQIVFVQGGVAQYRRGVYYTGMENPKWMRPLRWTPEWWYPIDGDPVAAEREACAMIAGGWYRDPDGETCDAIAAAIRARGQAPIPADAATSPEAPGIGHPSTLDERTTEGK